MKGRTHSQTQETDNSGGYGEGADVHTQFPTYTQTLKQHLTPGKVPWVTRTQHLYAALAESLWDKRFLQQTDTKNRKH